MSYKLDLLLITSSIKPNANRTSYFSAFNHKTGYPTSRHKITHRKYAIIRHHSFNYALKLMIFMADKIGNPRMLLCHYLLPNFTRGGSGGWNRAFTLGMGAVEADLLMKKEDIMIYQWRNSRPKNRGCC